MDREELKSKLEPFLTRCREKGRPLEDICLEDAFPGDSSTSYILKVKAPWVDDMYCSEALDFLLDIMWETVEQPIREKIFSVNVLDSSDDLHCWQETKGVN